MATTYDKIATTTLGTASSTIEFGSISSGYTDLRIVLVSVNDASSTQPVEMRFNSDSSTNYSTTHLYGNGGNAGSYRYTNANKMTIQDGQPNSTSPIMSTIDIFSYAGNTFKTVLITESSDTNGGGFVGRIVGLWRSTSAITTITLGAPLAGPQKFGVGSIATLYGILKA
jgi:hypothetical protein